MNSIKPNHYDLKIIPNFETFTFVGETTVTIQANEKISKITMNAMDLLISKCKLINGSTTNLKFDLDLNEEEIHIELPEPITGEFKLNFDYSGKIEPNLKGLYKTKYKVDGKEKAGAITQFQTEDARRAFPCFDEPRMKATFDIELVIDDKLTAISNMPIKEEKILENSKKSVSFERTPVMSTYLVFMAIADFEHIEKKTGDITVRVLTHPGKSQFGKESLDFSANVLEYCQQYFDIAYPLPKLDNIATPEFAAGAMENWGAISYRENLLLKFPGYTAAAASIYIQAVIAHEITHQWFGNLVSPSLWKFIWLNESFADYFGFKIVADLVPELPVWEYVISARWNVAWVSDAYIETVPIEIEEQKKTSYNIKTVPIIYMKGGSMIRMVENYVGEENFKKGLQHFLKSHSYDVASSDDLWTALEKTAEKPILKLMKSWVLQKGYPVVSVERQGKTLKFSQQRFTYLENSDTTLWVIPISIKIFRDSGEAEIKQFLLDDREGVYNVGENFQSYKLNNEQTGFYRVKYINKEDLESIAGLIKSERISTLDAWNLENDMYALFKSGLVNLSSYLDFISNFTSLKYTTSITAISNQLEQLYRLAEGDSKSTISSVGTKLLEEILDKIGYNPKEEEPMSIKLNRNKFLYNAGKLGSSKVIKFAIKEFTDYKDGKELAPDVFDAIVSLGISQTNNLEWLIQKYESASNEAEIVRLGNVFGEFSDSSIIDQILNELLFEKIPMRNIPGAIMRLCTNPHAISKMWEFFIAQLDTIEKLHRSIQGVVLNGIISNSVTEETRNDMQEFFKEYGKTHPEAKITAEKSFETLEINFHIKEYLNNI